MSRNGPEGPSTGTAPPVLMMAGQQRQHERSRLWLRVLGINPHVKDMTARKLLVGALAVLILKKGCANMSVGKKLRELRGSRTQDEISKELGITKSSYAMYERDERVPRDEVKVRISNFFGVSVQELFFN